MNLAAGPFAIAAALLALGGALKALRPADTAKALGKVGLLESPLLVRGGGSAEVVVGLYALAVGDRLSGVLVAGSYLAFTAFVLTALRMGAPISTCGCFGRIDTPPSVIHVGVNLLLAAAAVSVAVDPGVAMDDVLRDQPLGGAPFVLLVLTGLGLVFVALTTLPRTLASVQRESAP